MINIYVEKMYISFWFIWVHNEFKINKYLLNIFAHMQDVGLNDKFLTPEQSPFLYCLNRNFRHSICLLTWGNMTFHIILSQLQRRALRRKVWLIGRSVNREGLISNWSWSICVPLDLFKKKYAFKNFEVCLQTPPIPQTPDITIGKGKKWKSECYFCSDQNVFQFTWKY